jgi:hypothetical protein
MAAPTACIAVLHGQRPFGEKESRVSPGYENVSHFDNNCLSLLRDANESPNDSNKSFERNHLSPEET